MLTPKALGKHDEPETKTDMGMGKVSRGESGEEERDLHMEVRTLKMT